MKMNPLNWLRKQLESNNDDLVKAMVHAFAKVMMDSEVEALCNAEYGERTDERHNTRNGFRHRPWDTRVGTLDLAIPKLRKGSYFPTFLEPRRRAEKAIVSVVTEAYVLGVSTRRVDKLVQTMGMEGISKSQVSEMAKNLDGVVESFRSRPLESGPYPYVWLDALAIKCREEGRVVNVSALVATGVSADGHREILGIDVITRESGHGWLSFLRGLVARGLSGTTLVISDAHRGLVDAIRSAIPGASWQRCRTHFMRNILCRVPKSAQGFVATAVRTIFQQPDQTAVEEQHARVVEQLQDRFPDVADMLVDAADEILAFSAFPKAHWKQIWSNNPQERLNKEIRRRTDVVGIFPNRAAIIRLVGAVLAEQHDEWQVTRRYLSIDLADIPQSSGAEAPAMPTKEMTKLPKSV